MCSTIHLIILLFEQTPLSLWDEFFNVIECQLSKSQLLTAILFVFQHPFQRRVSTTLVKAIKLLHCCCCEQSRQGQLITAINKPSKLGCSKLCRLQQLSAVCSQPSWVNIQLQTLQLYQRLTLEAAKCTVQ